METHLGLAASAQGPPPHIGIRITTDARDGTDTWTVRWNVTGPASVAPDFEALGLEKAIYGYNGEPFSASQIPIPTDAWLGTPLALFLGRLCDAMAAQPVPVVIDDVPRDPEGTQPRPLLAWHRAPIITGGTTVPLGAAACVICRAVGPHPKTPSATHRCCILVGQDGPLPVLGANAAETLAHLCTPFRGNQCALLTNEDAQLLQALDAPFPVGPEVLSLYAMAVRRRLVVYTEKAGADEELRSGQHMAVAAIPLLDTSGMRMWGASTLEHLWDDPTPDRNLRLCLTLPISKQQITVPHTWLQRPYVQERPQSSAYISADRGLASTKCCLLLGAFVKLCWLQGLDLSTAAAHIHNELRRAGEAALLASLQFAAVDPFTPPVRSAPGSRPSPGPLLHLGSWLTTRWNEGQSDAIEAAFQDLPVPLERPLTRDYCVQLLSTLALKGQLMDFLTYLEARLAESTPAIRQFEESILWGDWPI